MKNMIQKDMRMLDMHAHLSCLTEDYAPILLKKMGLKGMDLKEELQMLGLKELTVRKENGIATCFSTGTYEEWEYMQQFRLREELLVSFGIHPWYAGEYWPGNYVDCFKSCDIIGEIGMDNVWCSVPLEIQRKNLEYQLRLASDYHKPVILHTKGQEKEIAALLGGFPEKVCIHWYSGDLETFEKFLELGCYFTFGPDLAWVSKADKASSMKELYAHMLRQIPEDRFFIETDGLSAVAWAKEEEYVPLEELPAVLEKNMEFLASCKKVSVKELQKQILLNLKDFLE